MGSIGMGYTGVGLVRYSGAAYAVGKEMWVRSCLSLQIRYGTPRECNCMCYYVVVS